MGGNRPLPLGSHDVDLHGVVRTDALALRGQVAGIATRHAVEAGGQFLNLTRLGQIGPRSFADLLCHPFGLSGGDTARKLGCLPVGSGGFGQVPDEVVRQLRLSGQEPGDLLAAWAALDDAADGCERAHQGRLAGAKRPCQVLDHGGKVGGRKVGARGDLRWWVKVFAQPERRQRGSI